MYGYGKFPKNFVPGAACESGGNGGEEGWVRGPRACLPRGTRTCARPIRPHRRVAGGRIRLEDLLALPLGLRLSLQRQQQVPSGVARGLRSRRRGERAERASVEFRGRRHARGGERAHSRSLTHSEHSRAPSTLARSRAGLQALPRSTRPPRPRLSRGRGGGLCQIVAETCVGAAADAAPPRGSAAWAAGPRFGPVVRQAGARPARTHLLFVGHFGPRQRARGELGRGRQSAGTSRENQRQRGGAQPGEAERNTVDLSRSISQDAEYDRYAVYITWRA